MDSQVKTSGPFGNYSHGSAGAVLNGLCNIGVPLNKVEQVKISKDLVLESDEKSTFARFKWFEDIEQPLFFFTNDVYGRQSAMWGDDKKLHAKFHLSLYVHDSASLLIYKDREKDLFTEELYDFMKMFLGANVSHVTENPSAWEKQNHEMYKIRQKAGAFFQGGHRSFDDGFIYIEFHQPKGAQAFVDYVNNNFVYEGYNKPPEHEMEIY